MHDCKEKNLDDHQGKVFKGDQPVRMPETTSKVKFFVTSSGSLHEGEGQRSGYPVPLH